MTTLPPVRRALWLRSRWWHKWVGIVIGVLVVVWLVSGILMLIPASQPPAPGPLATRQIEWDRVVVSPAQARAAASAAAGGVMVRGMSLQRLLGEAVYVVILAGDKTVIVRGTDGQVIRIDADVARAIASQIVPGVAVTSTERFVERPPDYFGKVPAYRIAFADNAETVAIVAEPTGELSRTVRRDRINTALGHDLHVFHPLRSAPGGNLTRKSALTLTSIIAVFSVLTGYWLALPRRWRVWPRRRAR